MKILYRWLLLAWMIGYGCVSLDPEIPDGFSSYQKGGMPKASIQVWELFSYHAVMKMDLMTTGDRKLTDVRFCFSETNPLPDTTDWVQDVFSQYKPEQAELSLSLSDLEPATNYYCRLYIANADSGSYTNCVVFSTKVPSNNTSWESVAAIPWTEEHFAAGFQFGDRYFALSSNYAVAGGNSIIEYLPDSDEWVKRSLLPFGCRANLVAVAAAGKGYAGLGDKEVLNEEGHFQYLFQQDWWCYDPVTNGWERKADIPASTTALMAAFSVEDKIYVVTSNDFWNTTPMQVWMYDTKQDSWSRKRDFPGDKLQHAASFVIDNRAFVFTGTTNHIIEGGNVETNKLEYTTHVWEYEADSDTWHRKGGFKGGGRELMVATACGGKGYAGFGFKPVTDTYQVAVVDWWMYSPDQDQWKRRSVLTEWFAMRPSFAFTLKENVYIGSSMGGVWKYVE